MELFGTLGPACARAETLEQMFFLGMTGLRLNLSHMMLNEAAPWLEQLDTAAARTGVHPKLLIDLQGPELRMGVLTAPMVLMAGRTVTLGAEGVPVPEIVLPHLIPGQDVLLDDGKLLLRVTEHRTEYSLATVVRGGVLQSRKSIALPGTAIYPPAMTEADRINIRAARSYGVTGVMQPFVRDREDLLTVRKTLIEAGCEQFQLLAKVENMDGVNRLPDFISAADEIVIARGDLGNAVPLWELPTLQKQLAAQCREADKPFMVSTQLLDSMEQFPIPTRAEVTDVFNAVLDGAASLMVTGETATGKNPPEVIRYLVNTAREAERFMGR